MFFFKKVNSSLTLRLVSSCLIVLLFAMSVFVALPQKAEAIGIPFGGMILSVFWCPCSFNLMVTIGPPVGGIFMYQPGATILYPFGQIWRPGAWTLGLWGAPGSCWVPCKGCCLIATPPTMLMVGTSL